MYLQLKYAGINIHMKIEGELLFEEELKKKKGFYIKKMGEDGNCLESIMFVTRYISNLFDDLHHLPYMLVTSIASSRAKDKRNFEAVNES